MPDHPAPVPASWGCRVADRIPQNMYHSATLLSGFVFALAHQFGKPASIEQPLQQAGPLKPRIIGIKIVLFAASSTRDDRAVVADFTHDPKLVDRVPIRIAIHSGLNIRGARAWRGASFILPIDYPVAWTKGLIHDVIPE